jgi:thioredoxin reductase (NADPH)
VNVSPSQTGRFPNPAPLLLLHYSRAQESEADHLGLIFMAMAGYDPRTAPTFWERMAAGKEGAPPEFMSTHPADATRIKDLNAEMPEALKYYRRVAEHYKLDIHQYEKVDNVAGADGEFRIHTTDRHNCHHTYVARKIILATGYYDIPNLLNVPGEDLPKVIHYYKEPHPYYNQDVAVIGAKNSAAIAALELYWTGARVTLIHRGAQISEKVKYWIRPNIENRIKNGEIKAYFHSKVVEIRPDSILVDTPQGEVLLKNDFVFALIGYSPDLAFLNSIGVTLDAATARPR